jgi:hypothetical protein
MSFTVKNVLDEVRVDLRNASDSDLNTRMLTYCSSGVRWIWQNKPESRLDDDGDLRDLVMTDFAAETESVPLEDVYRIALVAFIRMRVFGEESGDNFDQERYDRSKAEFDALIAST